MELSTNQKNTGLVCSCTFKQQLGMKEEAFHRKEINIIICECWHSMILSKSTSLKVAEKLATQKVIKRQTGVVQFLKWTKR